MIELLVVLVVVALVALVISAPLRRAAGRGGDRPNGRDEAAIAELEAARDAKYREIRDAELDFRTGKLSRDDYRALDRELRAEAIEILRSLDRARDEPAYGRGGDDRGRSTLDRR